MKTTLNGRFAVESTVDSSATPVAFAAFHIEQPNMQSGASAVIPCGVIPATDPQGRSPALGRFSTDAVLVCVEIDRSIRRGLPEDDAAVRDRG